MFKIDRNFVKIGAIRTIQTVREETETVETIEADAVEDPFEAAASAAIVFQAQAQEKAEKQALEIVRRAEAEAKEKASEILEEARSEAAELLIAAREQNEEERQKAFREGFAEGAEEGRHSYDGQLSEKMLEDDEILSRVIEELYEERDQTYGGLEDEVVELAINIVRKVINPSQENYGDSFIALIRNTFRQISPDGRIVIRVSPTEYERFFSSGNANFELSSGETVAASILRDLSLHEGDCIIDTENETINAGLDSQLNYIKLAFEKVER